MFRIICAVLLFHVLYVADMNAQTISLNGDWQFRTDVYNQGVQNKWYGVTADKSKWDSIKVPSCWNTRLEYSNYTGVAWYGCNFDLTNVASDKGSPVKPCV